MKLYVVLLLLLPCFVLAKESPKYPVSAIPLELKEKADVVFRKDISEFTIYSKNRATHSVLKVITILNANGKEYADEVIGYDRLSKITSIRGSVYNAEGELIRKVKRNL
jgi:hypothetical protein